VLAATLTAVPVPVRTPAATPAATQQKEVLRADEKLFELAIGGDRDALGELIGRYEKTLFGLLLRLTSGDPHRADDLFQETFLHAMRAGKTFDRKLSFKPWVTAIAVNLVRDDARKRKVRGEVGLDAPANPERSALPEPVATGENPGESAERKDEELVVQRALYGLTELEREVVLLHFYDSMTLVETAKVLDVPLGTIKSRLHAALTRLAGILGKKDEQEE
jgi:RNA polymerase sigma-70 factor (ECF subfamily)